jgi:tRNA pseudouridine32 synthase/23S rRNA pseudouridine746 synthase
MTLARQDRGDTIEGRVPDPGSPLRVLYETDDFIAVDKPEGVVSLATAGRGGLPELVKPHYAGRLFPVHRLDRGASGVILFAKTAEAHRDLNGQFERREVRKTYLAAVDGLPASNRGQINAPLREFGSGRMGVDPKRGRPASTAWKIAERLDDAALLRVTPSTGRRHQIRVHLYSIGHPILGDLRYGDKARQSRFPRLMLHALSLEFALPSGEAVTIEALPPASFEKVVASLRRKKPAADTPKKSGQRTPS